MNTTPMQRAALGAVVSVALAAAGYGLYALGKLQGGSHAAAPVAAPRAVEAASAPPMADTGPMSIAQGEEATRRHIQIGVKAGDTDPANGKKVLYYHDPMVPGNKFDKPAKSPFMDMMLVPVYADSGSGTAGSTVTISPHIQQNLGLRTAEVSVGTLAPSVEAVGNIAFNERDQVIVQARSAGFVEKLFVRATLDAVSKGQPLAELHVPDWVAAQEEFLSVVRMTGNDLAPLVDGARQRMRQAGMNDTQITAVESSGKLQPRFTVSAPIGGVVTELLLREGMTVMAGATLLRINGLGTVWANAEVPESQAALLRPGARVTATSPAVPGRTYSGTVQAILPEVDAGTRTLKARLELANPGGRLVPGMFVKMQISDPRTTTMLLVPTEAIVHTGRRTLVMLAEADGRFQPAEVQIGIESGGLTEVTHGLKAGQRVVVSAQFLIDSEASLRGIEARLKPDEERMPASRPGSKP